MYEEEPVTSEHLTQPHFDEEATLLSARPVVPLTKVNAKNNLGRRIILAAIVAAALLTAGTGLSLFYNKRNQSRNDIETTTDALGDNLTAGAVGFAESVEEPAPAPKQEEVVLDTRVETATAKNRASTRLRVSERQQKTPQKESIDSNDSTLDDLDVSNQQREERRQARREARRERREAARQAGETRPRRTSDLFRIREIFEGSPRP